ncbi:MAG TPA: recombinase family protein [Steroidobacteraceae bacterium]|jgi:DNA invertase Pin-like site-specific DNA recombinase|nr:recombinase family protein [Steroidobacteraceae bacterium]
MGKGKRVAFYLRVSTGSQTVENQRRELVAAAEQHGWAVIEIYSDNGISGAKGREQRPAFDRMCRDAVAGKFDIVAAWSVDRLGRSVLHLAQFVEEMRAAGVGLFLLKQGIDSETSTGRAMLSMCATFAELEREIIRERIHSGLARAKAKGKTLGRRPVSAQVEQRIRDLRSKGTGKRKIALTLRIGVSTVQRVLVARPQAGLE